MFNSYDAKTFERCPKSMRICNEMDLNEDGQLKRCGICRNESHGRQNCPNVAGLNSRS